jgi:hypothetical protein
VRRDQRGAALVELIWLGLLLLVPLVYVLLAVFTVQKGAYAVSGAARAAARAYALAPDESSAPRQARAAMTVALSDHDIGAGEALMQVSCRPSPHNCLAPGSVISVEVRHQVRLPLAPSALGDQVPSIRVAAEHAVGYGTFREDR